MRGIVPPIVAILAVAIILFATVSGVRWAKGRTTSASAVASALMLFLGMGIAVNPPQQHVEEARESEGKKGGESGDPPAG